MTYSRERLENMTLGGLKDIGKELKIKGYYRWNKATRNDAIRLILDAQSNIPSSSSNTRNSDSNIDVSTMGITDLKKLAKKLEIPRYNKYRKSTIEELRGIVIEMLKTRPIPVEKEEPVNEITSLNITNLKKLAKRLGVPSYSKYKKGNIAELQRLVMEYSSPSQEDDEEQVEEVVDQVEEKEEIEIPVAPIVVPSKTLSATELSNTIKKMSNTKPAVDSMVKLEKMIQLSLLMT